VGVASFPAFTDCSVEYPGKIDVTAFASRSAGKYRLVAVVFCNLKTKPSRACLDQNMGEWLFFHEGQAFVVDPSGGGTIGTQREVTLL
jgi:hypothetical protein